MQRKGEVEARVVREEEMYKVERQRQREEHERQKARREEVEATMAENDDVLEKRKRFFEERSSHCPETKLEMQEVIKEEGKSIKNIKQNQNAERILDCYSFMDRVVVQTSANIQTSSSNHNRN